MMKESKKDFFKRELGAGFLFKLLLVSKHWIEKNFSDLISVFDTFDIFS